jgi:hypothetical protein
MWRRVLRCSRSPTSRSVPTDRPHFPLLSLWGIRPLKRGTKCRSNDDQIFRDAAEAVHDRDSEKAGIQRIPASALFVRDVQIVQVNVVRILLVVAVHLVVDRDSVPIRRRRSRRECQIQRVGCPLSVIEWKQLIIRGPLRLDDHVIPRIVVWINKPLLSESTWRSGCPKRPIHFPRRCGTHVPR